MSRAAIGVLGIWLVACAGFGVFAGWKAFGGASGHAAPAGTNAVAASIGDGTEVSSSFRRDGATPLSAQATRTPAPTVRVGPYAPPDYAGSVEGFAAAPLSAPVAGPPATASKGVVVLDPGHGRGDTGAVHYLPDGSGRWDITEADSNLRNAELIRDRLVALGYQVYLTREGAGRGPDGPLPLQFISSDLIRRVQLARAVDADVYLSLHGNGAVVHEISGPEAWYCGKHGEGAANEQLALAVQAATMDALREYGYDPPDRGIKEDAEEHHQGDFCQFVVTRKTPVPAALLEFLFLTNDDDARVLVDDRAHVLLADHVAAAIDRFVTARHEAAGQGD